MSQADNAGRFHMQQQGGGGRGRGQFRAHPPQMQQRPYEDDATDFEVVDGVAMMPMAAAADGDHRKYKTLDLAEQRLRRKEQVRGKKA